MLATLQVKSSGSGDNSIHGWANEMDQMASLLSVRPQVSLIKTDTYEGIGQRLIGFCVYVSVVVRRFATGAVFRLFAVNIFNLSRPRLIKLAKIWKPLLLL